MLPNQVRRRVDAVWDRIWASGVSNPLTAMEYFSTILILRRLNDRAESGSEDDAGSVWNTLLEYVADGDVHNVSALMCRVQIEFGIGASPEVASASTWNDLDTLAYVLREVRELELTDRNHDILGDLFEYMLNHLSTAGHFGQFRTPRHLIRFVVGAVNPRRGETIVDPAVGTAGFLIAAHEHRRGDKTERYIGNEVDATIARVAETNLILHGMTGGRIKHEDSLRCKDEDADVILANPPFAGAVVADRVTEFQSGTLKTELLFVELMMRRLKPGGRAGVVVPTGVLTSSTAAAVWIRRQLVESNRLRAVVELPSGVFRPYTSIKTALLFWSKESTAEETLLIRVDHDGYSLDDKREPVEENDLPQVLSLLRGEGADIPHALVASSEIAKQKYNLSPSRYIKDDHRDVHEVRRRSLAESLAHTRRALAVFESDLERLEGLLR